MSRDAFSQFLNLFYAVDSSMTYLLNVDPFRILNLPFDAQEEVIRSTYHKRLQTERDSEILRQAYDLIRDEKMRKQYLWSSIHSYFLQPPQRQEELDLLEELATEVLFLSDWELEEIDASQSL